MVSPVSLLVAKSMIISPASTLPEPPLAKVGMVTEIATLEPFRRVRYSYCVNGSEDSHAVFTSVFFRSSTSVYLPTTSSREVATLSSMPEAPLV